MTKYRLKEYDELQDIHLLQKHLFWFWWINVGAGSRSDILSFIEKSERDSQND